MCSPGGDGSASDLATALKVQMAQRTGKLRDADVGNDGSTLRGELLKLCQENAFAMNDVRRTFRPRLNLGRH